MGNSKILLFDLDGTLLRNDKTLSEYTLETLSKCKRCGYLIGISTSRSEQNCLSFLREMKPDILISSGGALVRVNEKIICSSSFSITETKNFIESARKICGIGVAMGNAVQEVKNIADDITLSNEEDGVAAYLEKWII